MTPLLSLLLACNNPAAPTKHHAAPDDGGDPAPIDVAGFGSVGAIAGEEGIQQGEPAAVALPDGVIIASWMETQESYSLFVAMSRSTDNGETWETPHLVDKDRWGWQNDPAFAYTDGRVYYTWLAIESRDASAGSIYCIDSTDGGKTWGEKVKLSTESKSVDRQWLAADDSGHVVITWDAFVGNNESQSFSESTSGCAGFSEPETVSEGFFLNGVPVIDSDGNTWISRNEMGGSKVHDVISRRDGSDWKDYTIHTYEYPDGAWNAQHGEREEEGEEETAPWEWPDMKLNISANLFRAAHVRTPPRASASGNYNGEYSPILAADPAGGIVAVTLGTESEGSDHADVSFLHIDDGEVTTLTTLNAANDGVGQMEPWITVDPGGGIHASWYDATEGEWRLVGASSLDGGASFATYPIGDATFKRGFDENSEADMMAWVGHFQGLVATDDRVVAIYGDSHNHGTSRVYAAGSGE